MDWIPFRTVVPALVIGALLACSSPTDVDPLAVALRPIALMTHEEWLQWPSTPRIDGGQAIVVRGRAFVGCGRPEARAQRYQNVVGVEITAVETDRICLAVANAWVPFEAAVSGLAPGTYRVRVRVAGMQGRTEATATIPSIIHFTAQDVR